MQNRGVFIMLGVLAALVAVLLAVNIAGLNAREVAVPAYAAGISEAAANTIKVYGQGKIAVTPDQATITFGYENSNFDAAAAQDENKAKMQQIIEAVKKEGLKDNDLQTVSYQVYRNKGVFFVCNMMRVTTGDIEKTSRIIKAAYDAGANQFHNVRFDILKRQEAYTDALRLAMGRARDKAERLAADEGRKIAGVISVEEGTQSGSYYFTSPYSNFVGADSTTDGYSDGGISSGEMEISAIVNVTYRLY